MSVMSDTITGDFLQNKQGRAGVGEEEGNLDIETSRHTAAVWVRSHVSCMALPVSSLLRPEPQTQTDGRSTELEAQK